MAAEKQQLLEANRGRKPRTLLESFQLIQILMDFFACILKVIPSVSATERRDRHVSAHIFRTPNATNVWCLRDLQEIHQAGLWRDRHHRIDRHAGPAPLCGVHDGLHQCTTPAISIGVVAGCRLVGGGKQLLSRAA